MFNLIKLEIKKFKLQGYIKGAFITHLIVIAIFLWVHWFQWILQIEQEPVLEIVEGSTLIIGTMGSLIFGIFSYVISAKLIISEYSNKTINLMFTYPISRKKMFLAKLIIIVVFTFINIVISNILITLSLVVGNSIFHVLPWALTVDNILYNIPTMLLNAVLVSATILIPLYFGMKKKSVSATIVSGVIVSVIMNSNNKDITLQSILPVAIIVAIIGLSVGVGVLSKLDTEDVI